MHLVRYVIGFGIVHIKIIDGVVRTLGGIKHVLDLKRNLISLSALDTKGYKYTIEGGVLKISKGALVVMSKDNHVIYSARFQYCKRCCCCILFIIKG